MVLSHSDVVVNKFVQGMLRGKYTVEERGSVEIIEKIPAGVYEVSNIGGMMVKLCYSPVKELEKYISFSGGTVEKVLKKTEKFFSEETKRKHSELGIAHKTGFILHGIPGTGKTVTVNIIMKNLVEKYGALCLVMNSRDSVALIRMALNELETMGKPMVLFVDECESAFEKEENAWLTLLDGAGSLNNFITIGCTNFLEEISSRIRRPSRIEYFIEVECLEQEVAQQYLEGKLAKMPKDLKAAIAYEAVEAKVTMDEYKNAVKEFYINGTSSSIEEFKQTLTIYKREREKKKEIAGI